MPLARKKEHRINLRVTERDVLSIHRAAETAGLSVSAFILESATERAVRTLADQRNFVLSAEQWDAFSAALDRPAKKLPRLRKLMQEPSVLEQS